MVSPEEIVVPASPEEGSAEVELDLQEVERLAEERTSQMREAVAKWSGPNPAEPWTLLAFEIGNLVVERAKGDGADG